MAKKKFNIKLSVKDLNKLKKKIESYRDNELPKKLSEFVEKIAEVGIPVIKQNIAEASFTYDENGIQSGADTEHRTYVKVNSFADYAEATLILEGREVVYIEFGSGVYHNTSKGTSPHPLGKENEFLIGTYGLGNGAKQVWGYYAESGELVLTHGVKATMPMYKADLEIVNNVVRIAREVFN